DPELTPNKKRLIAVAIVLRVLAPRAPSELRFKSILSRKGPESGRRVAMSLFRLSVSSGAIGKSPLIRLRQPQVDAFFKAHSGCKRSREPWQARGMGSIFGVSLRRQACRL